MSNTADGLSFAWISRGRLFVKRGDRDVEEIESDFARNSLEREMRRNQNSSWKGRSGVWGEMGVSPPGAAPWEDGDQQRKIRFVTMAKGDSPEEIYYVLDMGAVGGLFKYDMDLEEETRLMHSQSFQARDLSRHPTDQQIAISARRTDGTMGLSITRKDGLFGKAITLSDTIDEAPSWFPDGSKRLVFQSSAIGRDDNGNAIGKSTARIETLSLEEEQIENLVEQEDHDLLQPRMTTDKTLYYIRRPYKADHCKPPTFLETVQDVVYFPFRLARAFIYFFNFMSMAFSGKPLMNAGGPESKKQKQDPFLVLYGQAVDTRKALAKGEGKADAPLVPKEWELVARSESGDETVIAQNVVAFDADTKGHLLYTNGRKLFSLAPGGKPVKVADGDLVDKVLLMS